MRLWDAESGALQQTLEVGRTLSKLSFGLDASDCLVTELGSIILNSSSYFLQWSSYGIKADGSWITWNGRDVIFLPIEYRPQVSSVRGQTIVIGCQSGQVLLLEFSSDKTPCA